jgi:hypothetical protein
MKKFIFIVNAIELIARLLAGESIEGKLYIDKETHVLTFKAWNRTAPKYTKYRKTGDTDYGSLWKSDKHLLWREKYPLSMGTDRILTAMEADKNHAQKNVVTDYIIGSV